VNIVVKARHMDVTDAMKEYVENKASKLTRFYDRLHTIEVILDLEADKPSVEIIASGKKSTFVASHHSDEMYSCIDQCLHKVSEQLRRHKDKVRDHQGPTHSETADLGTSQA